MLWKLWLYSLRKPKLSCVSVCQAAPPQCFKVMKSNHVSVAVSVSAGSFCPCWLLLFRKFLDYAGMLAHMVVWFLRKDSWKKCQRGMHRARKWGQRMQDIVFLVSACTQSFSCNSWCCTVSIKPAQFFICGCFFLSFRQGKTCMTVIWV